MTWRQELGRVGAVAVKDLTAEWRTPADFNAVTVFGAPRLLLFGFALGPDVETLRRAAPGVIWLTVLFSGVLAFNRSYEIELENDALETLHAYPGDRRTIFLGKLAANLTFVLLVEIVIVPLTAILYGLPVLPPLLGLAGILFLGTLGFVTLGTFYSALSSRSRAREVLLPLLLFPMLVPVLIAAAAATAALLAGDPMGDARTWAGVLVAFDVIFLVASTYAFEHVIAALAPPARCRKQRRGRCNRRAPRRCSDSWRSPPSRPRRRSVSSRRRRTATWATCRRSCTSTSRPRGTPSFAFSSSSLPASTTYGCGVSGPTCWQRPQPRSGRCLPL